MDTVSRNLKSQLDDQCWLYKVIRETQREEDVQWYTKTSENVLIQTCKVYVEDKK